MKEFKSIKWTKDQEQNLSQIYGLVHDRDHGQIYGRARDKAMKCHQPKEVDRNQLQDHQDHQDYLDQEQRKLDDLNKDRNRLLERSINHHENNLFDKLLKLNRQLDKVK